MVIVIVVVHIYLTLYLSYLDPNFGRGPQVVPGVLVVQFIFRMSSSSISFGKTIFTVCIFYQIASFDRPDKAWTIVLERSIIEPRQLPLHQPSLYLPTTPDWHHLSIAMMSPTKLHVIVFVFTYICIYIGK